MVSSVSKSESRFEKQRQLQIKLEQDQKELEVLQASLKRTNMFSDKVVLFNILKVRQEC